MADALVDISPQLLDKVKTLFNSEMNKDEWLKGLISRSKTGKLESKDTEILAKHLGDYLVTALQGTFTEGTLPDDKLYWNIAKSVVEPMLKQNHQLLNNVNSQIQSNIYAKMGVSINPRTPKYNQKRSDILLNKLVEKENLNDLSDAIGSEVRNFTFSMSDDFEEENADASYNVGFKTVVIRELGGEACEWCAEREGEYDYEDVKDKGNEVWQRHIGCDCVITFKSERVTETVRNYRTAETAKKYDKYKKITIGK